MGFLILFVLLDVIEAAPELPDDLGKNTKEFVALRCLEGLFASQNEVASDVPSAQGSKVGFDLSASCEDVLQQILQEVNSSFFVGIEVIWIHFQN